MSLVIELEESRRVRMLLLQVDVVDLGLFGGEATVLAHVDLTQTLINFYSSLS